MKTIEMVVNNEIYVIVNVLDRSNKKISKVKEYINFLSKQLDENIKGFIVLSNSDTALVKVEIINRDGSYGYLSANGILCAAKYLHEKKYTGSTSFDIETSHGNRNVSFDLKNNEIKNLNINLGNGSTNPKKIPMFCEKNIFINEEILVDNKKYCVTAVSVGNSHLVSFVDNIKNIDIQELGPKMECYYLFPERVNVEFAEILNEKNIRAKIWERGCGKAKSCGTASAAIVYAGIVSGKLALEDEYIIHTDSEIQRVSIDSDKNLHIVNSYHKVYKK